MKRSTLLLSGLGTLAAFLGLYFYLNWKGENVTIKKRESSDGVKKVCRHPKLSFRGVEHGDGLACPDCNECQLVGTRPNISFRSTNEELPNESPSVASLNSLTSYESSIAGGERLGNISNNSSSESDTGLAGAVGVSTYHRLQEPLGLSAELDELTHSPVVRPMFTDYRFQRREHEETAVHTPRVVVEYGGALTPIDVNGNIDNYSGAYSSIVPPLEPNTGTVIPPLTTHHTD